jgi:hypothetical protein
VFSTEGGRHSDRGVLSSGRNTIVFDVVFVALVLALVGLVGLVAKGVEKL